MTGFIGFSNLGEKLRLVWSVQQFSEKCPCVSSFLFAAGITEAFSAQCLHLGLIGGGYHMNLE